MKPRSIPAEEAPGHEVPSRVADIVEASPRAEAANNGHVTANAPAAMTPVPAAPGAARTEGSAEAPFRLLAFQLHHDMPREEWPRTVLLTTANTSPEAAQAGFALANALAEELQRPVLCVDVDVKLGQASRALGCEGARGFADLAADTHLRVHDVALPTSNPLLAFVPAGLVTAANRGRSLEQVERTVKALADGYDFVLLIGGAVLDDTMTLAVAPHVGNVVLFAFENRTMLTDLDQAQKALRFCKARRVALVFGTGQRA